MRMRILGGSELQRALPMREAVEAMKAAYAELASGRTVVPPRAHLASPGGLTLVMPASGPAGIAVKVVSVFEGNLERGEDAIQGLVVVLDRETGAPLALLEGAALTAWRTGAGGGAASDLLSRPDSRVVGLLGSGVQARTQLLALCSIRAIEEVRVHSRTAAHRDRFVAEMQAEVDARLLAVDRPEAAVEGADVVCTATPATAPLFDGERLEPGTHVTAVGSFTPEMREIDESTIRRARIFVDQRAAALEEAGELIAAVETGATSPDDWTELGRVVSGEAAGRITDTEITFFKSVGSAAQDLHAAARALEAAREQDLGQIVSL